MTTFQRRARWLVAIFAVGFAVMLAFAFKRRAPAPPPVVTSRTDPNSVVESTSGRVVKVKGAREDVSIEYDKQLTYKDGSTKLQGVKIVTTQRDGGRTFTVTGKEGSAAQNESAYTLHGDVRLLASDGLSAVTEHATFTESDGMVRAPGPVAFSRKELTGSGIGMTYDNNQDVLVVLDQAHVKVTGRGGGGTTEITSATATLARRDRYVRFDQTIKALRAGQIIEADSAVAHLSEDEERLESVELRGHSRVTASNIAPGALQSVTGRDMDLKYGPDGESLEHVLITGDAVLQLAGQKSASGRQIKATILDIGLAADGSTPVAVIGREAVQLTFQAEQGVGSRTITAMNLDARGEPGKGLTKALFTGAGTPGCADRRTAGPECYVEYREQNAGAGLFFIKSIASVNRDFFVIYSGTGFYKLLKKSAARNLRLHADPFADRHSCDGAMPSWPGTVVGVDITLNQTEEFSRLLDAIRETYGSAVRERRKERHRRPRFT